MFVYRGFVMLYTTANVFLVGILLPTSQVAFYGIAEKLFSAITGLFGPFAQTVFPRMNYLLRTEPHKAVHLAKAGLSLVVGGSLIAVLGGWLVSPEIIRILFGTAFASATPLFKTMSLALPFIAVSQILGIQCLLPLTLLSARRAF
jgi:PST family polysaccharide transporter